MGKLIAVVGNSGVGKTTLVRALCQRGSFVAGLEQHPERPFQHLFSQNNQRWGLANQVDYLLYRAEQEQIVWRARASASMTVGWTSIFSFSPDFSIVRNF